MGDGRKAEILKVESILSGFTLGISKMLPWKCCDPWSKLLCTFASANKISGARIRLVFHEIDQMPSVSGGGTIGPLYLYGNQFPWTKGLAKSFSKL